MNKTLDKIVNMYGVLDDLSKTSKIFSISYWITKNMNILKENYEFFINERQKIYEDFLNSPYITQEENSNITKFLFKDTDQIPEFTKLFNELLSMECEIQPYTIKLSVLMDSNIEITPEQLGIIECLIDETE